MAEQALLMRWGVEKRPTWAANIAAASAAFQEVTGRPATHIVVSTTAPPPPLDCKFTWRASISVLPGTFLIGTEGTP
jgi:hypothetical protein